MCVPMGGLEPPTPCVSGKYSDQLSYTGIFFSNKNAARAGFEPATLPLTKGRSAVELSSQKTVEAVGIEPTSPCLQSRVAMPWNIRPHTAEKRKLGVLLI